MPRHARLRHRAVALVAGLLLAPPLLAQGPPPRIEIRRGDEVVFSLPEPEGAVRVLFVGNSLTYFNEVPWLMQRVVESVRPEPPVVTRFSGRSGEKLERHWTGDEVRRLLRTWRWDHVVLQEQSSRPLLDPDNHRRYLALLVERVREHGAMPVIFETWPARREQEKHAALGRTYRRLAADLGVPLAPVRTAWETALDAGIPLYRDAIHSNLAGAYLTACVLAATLFDLDPRGATHTFPTDFAEVPVARRSLVEERLTPETARKLQEVAWKTVMGSRVSKRAQSR